VTLEFPSFTLQIPGQPDQPTNQGYVITIIQGVPKEFRHNEPLPIQFQIPASMITNGNTTPVYAVGSVDRKGNLTISGNESKAPLQSGTYDFQKSAVVYKIRKAKIISRKDECVKKPENVLVNSKQSNALWSQGTFGALFDYSEYHEPDFVDGEFEFIWPANNPNLPDIVEFPRLDIFTAAITKKKKTGEIECALQTNNVSQRPGTQAEGGVVIDPTNTLRRVAVYQDRKPNRRGFFRSYSVDGGQSWVTDLIAFTDTPQVPLGGSDPHVRFDQFGNCWVYYLAPNDPNVLTPPIRAILLLSIDGGITFDFVDQIRLDGPFPPLLGIDFGWVATGPDGDGCGSVWYGGGQADTDPDGQLTFRNYILRGTRVLGLGNVEQNFREIRIPTDNAFSFPAFDIGNDGSINLVFESRSENRVTAGTGFNAGSRLFLPMIFVRVENPLSMSPVISTPKPIAGRDGGDPRTGIYVGEVGYAIPAQLRRGVTSSIQVRVDRSCGPNRGRIYASFTDEVDPITRPGPTDVLVLWSDDQGKTWSPILKVNDNTNLASAFLGGLGVDNKRGQVGVAWLDTRKDQILQKTQPFATIFEAAPPRRKKCDCDKGGKYTKDDGDDSSWSQLPPNSHVIVLSH
jgi:hypothetical protein